MATPAVVDFILRAPFRTPGITTAQLARKTQLSAAEVRELARGSLCHIDDCDRWWTLRAVEALNPWCLVQSSPDIVTPDDRDWHEVRDVIDRGALVSIDLRDDELSAAWTALAPRRLIVFKPHLAALTGGPW